MNDETAGVVYSDVLVLEADADATGEAFSPHRLVFAVRNTPDWVCNRVEQLHALLQLKENWDSYGAEPMDPRSVVHAENLLRWLARFVGVEAPTVTASPDGHAALCWDDGQRSLEVEVRSDGVFQFTFIDEKDASRDEEAEIMDAGRLAELLTQL